MNRTIRPVLCLLLCLAATAPFGCTLPPAQPTAPAHPLGWLTGHWVGSGFGGQVEEVWLPEHGGAMAGIFRQLVDDQVRFYEIFTIAREGEALQMHLKHFHADLRGWEERDEVRTWQGTVLSPTEATFGPVHYQLVEPDLLRASVTITENGTTGVEHLMLRRTAL